jgi:hypothetical protein
MPRGKSEDHKHADLEKELANLRKEVAALKALLAKQSARGSGGADPRVDKLIEAVKLFGTTQRQKLEKAGL